MNDLSLSYLVPLEPTIALGAAILIRRGNCIPVCVETPAGLVPCWFLFQCGGGVMVSRCSDGRESNFPVPIGRVLVDPETAEKCREAEAARAEAARYVVRASGRVNNGRAHGFKSLRGRR